MRLLLHIFRKDVRHFYPEILVNVALLVAFAWAAPSAWQGGFSENIGHLIARLLRLLLPLGWLVLISRVIQDEVLVGDRPFWLTRPYRWQLLLVEKACFLLVFLHLPFFLMQCYLLHHAQLAVLPALRHLLQYQGYLAVVFLLPFVAVAVVTASFGQQVLSVLAGVLYLVLSLSLLDGGLGKRMQPPHANWIALALGSVVLVAVVITMYAHRPVQQARTVLSCLPAALMLIVLCLPTRSMVHQAYAASRSDDALIFDPDPKLYRSGTATSVAMGKDVLWIFRSNCIRPLAARNFM